MIHVVKKNLIDVSHLKMSHTIKTALFLYIKNIK